MKTIREAVNVLVAGGHNATHVYNADTSNADGRTAANIEGRARMLRMFKLLRNSVPGCERAVLKTMYPFALSRETYRTLGEYVMTRDDFLQAAEFDDQICNAFNYVDNHSQKRAANSNSTKMRTWCPRFLSGR